LVTLRHEGGAGDATTAAANDLTEYQWFGACDRKLEGFSTKEADQER
jgi:hypothetical protein